MVIDSTDIDFRQLSGQALEELCFDLLRCLGFHALTWRSGGQDRGRDIEAKLTLPNPLLGDLTELWYFECKNHSAGIDVSAISSKFDWADVQRPDHLAILAVPYLTTSCKDWITQRRDRCSYRVHVVEEKQLKELVLRFPELSNQYFMGLVERLFRSALIDWLIAGLWPGEERVNHFLTHIQPSDLDMRDTAFLFASHAMASTSADDMPLNRLEALFDVTYRHAVVAGVTTPATERIEYLPDKGLFIRRSHLAQGTRGYILGIHCQLQRKGDVYEGEYIVSRDVRGGWMRVLIARSTTHNDVHVDISLLQPNRFPDDLLDYLRGSNLSLILLGLPGFETESATGDDILVRRKTLSETELQGETASPRDDASDPS